jgi:G:T-mismatch repair DNA endonuclease (very short patch repair protein)
MHHGTETCCWSEKNAEEEKEDKVAKETADDKRHVARLQQQILEMQQSYELLYQRNVALSAEVGALNQFISTEDSIARKFCADLT